MEGKGTPTPYLIGPPIPADPPRMEFWTASANADAFSSLPSGKERGVDGREWLGLTAYSWAGSVAWARGCHGTPGLNSGMSASNAG